MLKLLFILIVIGLLGLLMYFMPIQIKFKLIRKDENDLILIRYRSLYGIVNLKFELPMFDIVFVNGKPALKYKAEIESNRTSKLFKRFSKIFTAEDYKNIRKYFRNDKVLLERLKEYWLQKLHIQAFSFILKFGLLDAAFTAVLCGAAWVLLGAVLAITKENLDFHTKDIVIGPLLNKEGFEIEISCIINFRLGDIINTGILVLKRRRELKKAKRSSDTSVNC